MCLRMNADLGRNAEERESANKILNEVDDKAILKLLREETTLIVLMVRIANQERRERFEEDHHELFDSLEQGD